MVVEDYEVPKPFHQLDLFKVSLILFVVVVVDPYYKKRGKYLIFKI